MIDEMLALWTWPLQAARLGTDLAGTWADARQVVAARLPVIAAAAVDPVSADHVELGRMVTEKVDAAGRSGRTVAAASARVQATSRANARAFGALAGGGMLWPTDWLRLFEDNLATAVALTTLPGRSLAPIKRKAAANRRRLAKRR